jgi:hypothetical protein
VVLPFNPNFPASLLINGKLVKSFHACGSGVRPAEHEDIAAQRDSGSSRALRMVRTVPVSAEPEIQNADGIRGNAAVVVCQRGAKSVRGLNMVDQVMGGTNTHIKYQ